MAAPNPNPTKYGKQRLKDLMDAGVPMWKIEQVLRLKEQTLRRQYPDLFENIETTALVRKKVWEPSPEQTRQIEIMAGLGIENKRIALVIGVPKAQLEAQCGELIARASAVMDMKVGANIFKMATGPVDSRNTAIMAQLWAKTRMKWQETNRLETTGAEGGPIQNQIQIFLPDNGRSNNEISPPTIDGDLSDDPDFEEENSANN